MKNKKMTIFLIIFLSIIFLLLAILMIFLLNGKHTFLNIRLGYKVSETLVLDKTYELNFENIDIESTSGDIYIKTGNNENVKVVIYGDKDRIHVNTTDDKLSIKADNKKCIGICINQKIAKIEVYLPSNYNHQIKVTNDYGKIDIDSFLEANMEIKEDCGDVKIKGGNVVNASNSYGDIEIDVSNTANIKQSCGDIKIGLVQNITAENNYGDIHIDKVSNYLDLINNCGDIKINEINLTKDSNIEDDLGDVKIGITNEVYIDAKTNLGDIKINNNYHKSDITLKIENSLGDIKINN